MLDGAALTQLVPVLAPFALAIGCGWWLSLVPRKLPPSQRLREGLLPLAMLGAGLLLLGLGWSSAWPGAVLLLTSLAGGAWLLGELPSLPRTARLAAALLLATGAATRWGQPLLPGNWYVAIDLHPASVSTTGYTMTGRSLSSGLWAALAAVSPLPEQALFLTGAVVGLIGLVAWLVALGRSAPPGRSFPPGVLLCFAALAGSDPILARLSCTDIPQNWALLWSGLGALAYRRWLASGHWAGAGAVMLIGALPGLIRQEYLTTPLLALCVFGWGRAGLRALPLCLVGPAASLLITYGESAMASAPLTAQSLARWLSKLFLQADPSSPFSWPFVCCVLLAGIAAWRMWGWRGLSVLLAPLLLTAPRLPTAIADPVFARSIVSARYDLVVMLSFHLLAALSLGLLAEFIAGALRASSSRPLPLLTESSAALVLLALAHAVSRFPAASPVHGHLYSFQLEYAFLRQVLPTLPSGARVLAYWEKNAGPGTMDLDAALTVPYPSLTYLRPDLDWQRLDGNLTLPERPGPAYLFQNTLLSLPPAVWESIPGGAYLRHAEMLGGAQVDLTRLREDGRLRLVSRQSHPAAGLVVPGRPFVPLELTLWETVPGGSEPSSPETE